MKVLGITGFGVCVLLCSGAALAQAPGASAKPAPTVPAAEPSPPTDAAEPSAAEAPPASDAPAPPPEPKKEAPRAHVVWAESSPDAPPAESDAAETPAEPTPQGGGWSLTGPHFALSVERVTNVLAWSKTVTIAPPSGVAADPLDIDTSGVDVSFLGGGALRSPSGVPRVAFDVVFDGGFSIGGALSYMTSSGKLAANRTQPGSDLPDSSLFLFAPRVGVLFSTSSSVGLWLRGGITRTSVSSSTTISNNGSTVTETDTSTAWNVTLDPQLVLVAAPHVGITLGGLLDIGIGGSVSVTVDDASAPIPDADYKNSAYGVTGGLVALF